jgi:hypothetical protein
LTGDGNEISSQLAGDFAKGDGITRMCWFDDECALFPGTPFAFLVNAFGVLCPTPGPPPADDAAPAGDRSTRDAIALLKLLLPVPGPFRLPLALVVLVRLNCGSVGPRAARGVVALEAVDEADPGAAALPPGVPKLVRSLYPPPPPPPPADGRVGVV